MTKMCTFKLPKFWSSDDVNLFVSIGFKVSILDVSLPYFKVIQFGNMKVTIRIPRKLKTPE